MKRVTIQYISARENGFVEEAFEKFKKAHTFHYKKEAKKALANFIKKWAENLPCYPSPFLNLIRSECEDAMHQLETLDFPRLGKHDTIEWFIMPAGIALVKRHYFMGGLTRDDILYAEEHSSFPGDFTEEFLIECSSPDNVPKEEFMKFVGIKTLPELFVLTSLLPPWAYTGSPKALSSIRYNLGATYYYSSPQQRTNLRKHVNIEMAATKKFCTVG